jgi:predicted Zn-dependent protease
MATYTKFQDFSQQLVEGIHDWNAHTFKVMLTLTAPVVTNTVKADLTEIAAGNGYTAGGTATTIATSETTGTTTVTGTEITWTASGGAIANFRYAVLYNDTAASDNLVAFWDYGSTVTVASGETFNVKFNNATPGTIFTLA